MDEVRPATTILQHLTANLLFTTFSGATRFAKSPFKRITVRPVDLREGRRLQISRFDGKKDLSTNHTPEELPAALADVLAAGFANVHVTTATEEIDIRLTKKGQLLVGRKKRESVPPPATEHNRPKDLPLPEGRNDPLLAAMGILDRNHRVRPTMRDKFTQINEFLKLLAHVLPEVTQNIPETPSSPGIAIPGPRRELLILDCGCGSSHLTLATAHFLNHIQKIPARVIGIDRNDEVITKSRQRAADLATRGVMAGQQLEFHTGNIGSISDIHADIVLALHACDTATDDALAQALRSHAKLILAVPCCHRDLHSRLRVPALAPIHDHGILHQRQADLVTDAFRALLLKVCGYRAEVIEFISPEHTARNLMIRAVRTRDPGDKRAAAEYRAFKQFTGVTPYLEKAVRELLPGLL